MKTSIITLTIVLSVALTAIAGDGDHGHHHKHHNHNHHYGYAYQGSHYGYPQATYGYGNGYGHGHYGYSHRSGTYYGNLLQGAAAVINAQGQFNRNTAVAANLIQNAKSLELDNQLKRAQVHFAKKEVRNAALKTISTEQAVARRQRIASSSRPDRLSPSQYRADLGLLNWPSMLLRPEFEALRKQVDSKVAVGISAMKLHGSEIHQLVSEMREDMKPLLRQRLVTSNDYALAARFIKSLQYESQLSDHGMSVASIGN